MSDQIADAHPGFVRLTGRQDLLPIYVRASAVDGVKPDDDYGSVVFSFEDDSNIWRVRETPYQVLTALAAAEQNWGIHLSGDDDFEIRRLVLIFLKQKLGMSTSV